MKSTYCFSNHLRELEKRSFIRKCHLNFVGVQLHAGGDNLGQQYTSPEVAVQSHGADVIIVGRGITKSSDPAAMAKNYQTAGYNAYLELLQQ